MEKKLVTGEVPRNKKIRRANLELLRCLAMMMVIVLHFLGKGELLGDLTDSDLSLTGAVAWFLEALCIVAVNVYMLISGFFLCESSFKLSRLLSILLQVWFYSVVVGVMALLFHVVPAEEVGVYFYLRLLFPISMGHYWFLTAYVFLYLLIPFLTIAVRSMTKQQLGTSVVLLLIMFSVFKSVLPVRLDMDAKGYDCLWYICVFLAAAYVRRFGLGILKDKKTAFTFYVLGMLAVFAEVMVLHAVYVRTGKLELLLNVSMEYNHIFTFLAALGLFTFFLQIEFHGGFADFVRKIAPHTLGVYLLHENLGIRTLWPWWFGAGKIASVGALLGCTLMAVAAVFTAGIIVDYVRSILMSVLHRGLLRLKGYRKLIDQIDRVDERFRFREER